MISIDWAAVFVGAALGIVIGALFFMGLAAGMRLALRSENPVKVLGLSAGLRILALLGSGWLVLMFGGAWAALGFVLAFFLVRVVATTLVRIAPVSAGAS
jgi:hypothetical protein